MFFDRALLGCDRLAADDSEFDVVSLDGLTASKRSYAVNKTRGAKFSCYDESFEWFALV